MKLFSLVKFGKKEHLLDFLIHGKLHFSALQELRKNSDEDVEEIFRKDSVEGVTQYRSFGPTKILIPINPNQESLEVSVQNITYWSSREFILGNICSFYAITTDCFVNNELTPIDQRLNLFGSWFIVIYNFDEFINRLETTIKEIRTLGFYGNVDYFDEKNFISDLHLFKKRSRYDYQKEFRIYLQNENTTAMDIYLGNLEDIAFIAPVEALKYFKMILNKDGSVLMEAKFDKLE